MEGIPRIDTHVHVLPSSWRQSCQQLGYDMTDGMPGVPHNLTNIGGVGMDTESQIAIMDKTHVSKAILSISSPGTHVCYGNDELARKITREANIEVSQICAENPTRLEFFASLPLPDVEGSLAEIDYALEELGAVGFVVMTNAHGVYLGDSLLEPVFRKLNERKAMLFMHPTQCHIKGHPEMDKPLAQYPAPMLEFLFDTVRAVTNLLLSGTVSRYPDIKFIVAHCGAALPPLVERFSTFSSTILKNSNQMSSDSVKHLFKTQFYFDLAGFPFPDLIHGFLRISDKSRLLYGSDYPYTPVRAVEYLGKVLDEELPKIFDDATIRRIYSGNAQELLDEAKKEFLRRGFEYAFSTSGDKVKQEKRQLR